MQIRRGDIVIAEVTITDDSYRDFSIMGDDYVLLDFFSETEIDFRKNDYCFVFGERFSIIEKPVPTLKKGIFYYNFKLYNTYRELEKVKVFLFDGTRDLTQSDFSYVCTPLQLVQLIVNNLNAVQDHNWSVGNVIESDVKTITVTNQNCLELLSSAASEWDTEWYVQNYTVNLTIRVYETVPRKVLELGTGLRTVEQEENTKHRAITRLYAFGGTKNLPSGYGSARLKMDVPYLEIAALSVVEDVQIFDQIFPRRTGTVSSARQSESGIFYFTDEGLDFDPNELQIDGLAKHIVFQSGALVGLDFEVNYKIREEAGEFEIIQYQEASGDVLPSASLAPGVGDSYILYNIEMPGTYVTAAANELKAAAQAYFDKNTPDELSFNISLDEVLFTANNVTLEPGENITLKQAYIEVLKAGIDIRVTAFKRYINKPNKFESVKVSDAVYANPITSIQNKVEDIEEVINRTGISSPNYIKRSWRDIAEIASMVNAVIAKMLLIGDEQGQFTLTGISFTANAVGNPNSFTATAGQLIHKTIPDEEEPGTWIIPAFSATLESETTPYWLYAKCARTTNEGVLIFSTTEIAYDSDPDYWHFFIGMLSSLHQSARTFRTLYGFTLISGNQIITGIVQSADGSVIINLSENWIQFGDEQYSIRWNKNGDGKLVVKGLIIQSPSGEEFPAGVYRGDYNPVTVYYKGDEVTHDGSSWLYINNTPGAGHTPTEGSYWHCKGAAGVDGSGVEFIFTRNNTGATPDTPVGDPGIDDYIPAGWTDNQQGVTGSMQYEFVSKRVGTTGNWGPFSTPKLWAKYAFDGTDGTDGSGVEFIFTRNNTGATPDTPVGDPEIDDYIPAGWTDNQQGVTGSMQYEFVSKRVGTTGNWGPFSTPKLWAKYAFDGNDAPYWEYRYAKNGSTTVPPSIVVTDRSPAGWTIAVPDVGVLEYLWITRALVSYDGSELVQNWTNPARLTGVQGNTGPIGPAPTYQGLWVQDAGKTYYGNTKRVDIVKYNGVYYVTRTDAGTFTDTAANVPTNTAKWNEFGAQFESVATQLLFAELAYVENLGVRFVCTASSGARIFIDGDANAMKLYDSAGTLITTISNAGIKVEYSGYKFLRINESPTSPMLAVRSDDYVPVSISTYGTSPAALEIISNNGAGKAIESYGNHVFTARSSETIELNGRVFGQMVRPIVRYDTTSLNLESENGFNYEYIEYIGSGTCNVYLPTTALNGRVAGKKFFFRRTGTGLLYVNDFAQWIKKGTGNVDSFEMANLNWTWMVEYDGAYWLASLFER